MTLDQKYFTSSGNPLMRFGLLEILLQLDSEKLTKSYLNNSRYLSEAFHVHLLEHFETKIHLPDLFNRMDIILWRDLLIAISHITYSKNMAQTEQAPSSLLAHMMKTDKNKFFQAYLMSQEHLNKQLSTVIEAELNKKALP